MQSKILPFCKAIRGLIRGLKSANFQDAYISLAEHGVGGED